MSYQQPDTRQRDLEDLVASASKLGYEIVDVAGFLDLINEHANTQAKSVVELRKHTNTVNKSTERAMRATEELSAAADQSGAIVETTVTGVRDTNAASQSMATWVRDLSERTSDIKETLDAVKKNNTQIGSIARQVNTLAINAKIEAARAGEAGLGFAVVADAINGLSQQTSNAAVQITENIASLTSWIMGLSREAQDIVTDASKVLKRSERNDESLTLMQTAIASSHTHSQTIVEEVRRVRDALNAFVPRMEDIDTSVTETTGGIRKATQRINNLIDVSESIVQRTTSLGGAGPDYNFVMWVQSNAAEISRLFTHEVESGRISMAAMFDNTYVPIPGTDPVQVTTAFTEVTDRLLPAIQEPALSVDPKVVFSAAVNTDGYLPTHNLKFAQPQSDDPVWNTANCRNRRIFDDRVGLKAGRNKEPFLVQVYRRDMGGGNFVMMKDISAPIFVGERHWGGLRFAIKF